MARLTLLQEKNRPVHKLDLRRTTVAFTWCGVDPCRKGVTTEGVQVGTVMTCKDCKRAEAAYLEGAVVFGGAVMSRGQAIAIMQKEGHSKINISRWLQGADRRRQLDGSKP